MVPYVKYGSPNQEKIGCQDKKVKVMIIIMNFFGHDHDDYKN